MITAREAQVQMEATLHNAHVNPFTIGRVDRLIRKASRRGKDRVFIRLWMPFRSQEYVNAAVQDLFKHVEFLGYYCWQTDPMRIMICWDEKTIKLNGKTDV